MNLPERDLDEGDVDRLLDGKVAPRDAPPEWEAVAALLRAAGERGTGGPPSAELLAGLVDAARAPDVVARRRLGFGALAVGALVVGGTGVAAAAGSLPDPVQDVVHHVVAVVGVDVPRGDEPDGDGDRDRDGDRRPPAVTTEPSTSSTSTSPSSSTSTSTAGATSTTGSTSTTSPLPTVPPVSSTTTPPDPATPTTPSIPPPPTTGAGGLDPGPP